MSYSVHTREGIAGSELRTALDAAIEEQMPRGSDGSVAIPGAVADHLGAATAAIEQWFAPVLGKPEFDAYQIVIEGHANPGHTWADGYADEYLAVTVRVHHAKPDAQGEVTTVQDNSNASPLESTPLVPVPPQQEAVGVTAEQHDPGNVAANAPTDAGLGDPGFVAPAPVDVQVDPAPVEPQPAPDPNAAVPEPSGGQPSTTEAPPADSPAPDPAPADPSNIDAPAPVAVDVPAPDTAALDANAAAVDPTASA